MDFRQVNQFNCTQRRGVRGDKIAIGNSSNEPRGQPSRLHISIFIGSSHHPHPLHQNKPQSRALYQSCWIGGFSEGESRTDLGRATLGTIDVTVDLAGIEEGSIHALRPRARHLLASLSLSQSKRKTFENKISLAGGTLLEETERATFWWGCLLLSVVLN